MNAHRPYQCPDGRRADGRSRPCPCRVCARLCRFGCRRFLQRGNAHGLSCLKPHIALGPSAFHTHLTGAQELLQMAEGEIRKCALNQRSSRIPASSAVTCRVETALMISTAPDIAGARAVGEQHGQPVAAHEEREIILPHHALIVLAAGTDLLGPVAASAAQDRAAVERPVDRSSVTISGKSVLLTARDRSAPQKARLAAQVPRSARWRPQERRKRPRIAQWRLKDASFLSLSGAVPIRTGAPKTSLTRRRRGRI